MSLDQEPFRRSVSNTMIFAITTLVLTSIHHVYGAYRYATPWRLDAVFVSGITAALILPGYFLLRSRVAGIRQKLAFILFAAPTVAIPLLMIGLFEGLYNHIVKDVVYFGGASNGRLLQLFPPPMYEMPNDVFFEVTGVLQVIPAALAAWWFYKTIIVSDRPERVRAGAIIDGLKIEGIKGEPVHIPDDASLVHLQFRRFAGCPICNLHLRSFAKRREELAAVGISEVVVFHSTKEDLLRYEGHMPFSVIADPQKQLYKRFGVESSARSLLDPRAWSGMITGVLLSSFDVIRGRQPLPPIGPKGGSLGLPADLLIDPDGRVVACKYGEHADDQWSVDDLLKHAESLRGETDGAPTANNRFSTEHNVAGYLSNASKT